MRDEQEEQDRQLEEELCRQEELAMLQHEEKEMFRCQAAEYQAWEDMGHGKSHG